MLEKGANVSASTSMEAMTPMHFAAMEGYDSGNSYYLETVTYRSPVKPHSLPRPLYKIPFIPHRGVEMVLLLLENGAVLDVVNSLGETPLFLAARGGHADAIKIMVSS